MRKKDGQLEEAGMGLHLSFAQATTAAGSGVARANAAAGTAKHETV